MVTMQRIAICDNNVADILKLREQIEKFAERLNIEVIIDEYVSATNLLFRWENLKLQADILYLNIDMPEVSGIEVAEKLRAMECSSEIIFYTTAREEVFEAFDVEALNYILKDETSIQKQEEIFRRAVERLNDVDVERITFHYGCEYKRIRIKEIKYFTVVKRVVKVYYGENQTFEFYSNLVKLEDTLFRKGFLRVNRGILINMAYVDKWNRTEVIMRDGSAFEIGTRYRNSAEERFMYYFRETVGT
jgi:DNA-binding LytR/AlgR family response regulator